MPDRASWFIKVPEPKSAKNRLRVDLSAQDRPAEVARLVTLGATAPSEHDEWGAVCNEFCVGGGGH